MGQNLSREIYRRSSFFNRKLGHYFEIIIIILFTEPCLIRNLLIINVRVVEKEVNIELEKQRQRYKPESLQELTTKTGFSRREIQVLYRSFKEVQCFNS